MSSVAIDFSGLFTAFGIGLVCATLGTMLLWKLAAGLPTIRRGTLAVLGALGLAGLAAAFATYSLRQGEIAAFALGFTILLQLVALPVLILIERRKT
jgi:hypothetical protein